MESSIVEQEEAEADPFGPNRWSNEDDDEDEEAPLVFFMSILIGIGSTDGNKTKIYRNELPWERERVV